MNSDLSKVGHKALDREGVPDQVGPTDRVVDFWARIYWVIREWKKQKRQIENLEKHIREEQERTQANDGGLYDDGDSEAASEDQAPPREPGMGDTRWLCRSR